MRSTRLLAGSRRLVSALIAVTLVIVVVGGYVAVRELGLAAPSSIRLASITFSSTTTLSTAVHEVTDAGLQPILLCGGIDQYYQGQTVLLEHPWTPVFSATDAAAPAGILTVEPTPLAPADWTNRLHTLSGATSVSTYQEVSCPAIMRIGPVPPGVYATISQQQDGETAQVTFASSVPYDAAIFAISAQALRLANPCREGRWNTRAPLLWTSAGQEATYTVTHQLIVATSYTAGSSSHWLELLHALPIVTRVAEPAPKTAC